MFENTIEFNSVFLSYPDFKLQDVSFKLPKGYFLGLIGPNGSGKSTLIKLITSLLTQDQGEIKLFGEEYSNLTEINIKDKIGFVYEQNNYPIRYKLNDFGTYLSQFYSKWNQDKYKYLVDKFNLDISKTIGNLSAGELKRFSLVLALSHNAELLLLDEPTTHLDPYYKEVLLNLLKSDFLTENSSIVYSTHYTDELENQADYLLYLNKGEVNYFGETNKINLDQQTIYGSKEILENLKNSNLITNIISENGIHRSNIQKDKLETLSQDIINQLKITKFTIKDLITNDYKRL